MALPPEKLFQSMGWVGVALRIALRIRFIISLTRCLSGHESVARNCFSFSCSLIGAISMQQQHSDSLVLVIL
jgi:hypothetical protein